MFQKIVQHWCGSITPNSNCASLFFVNVMIRFFVSVICSVRSVTVFQKISSLLYTEHIDWSRSMACFLFSSRLCIWDFALEMDCCAAAFVLSSSTYAISITCNLASKLKNFFNDFTLTIYSDWYLCILLLFYLFPNIWTTTVIFTIFSRFQRTNDIHSYIVKPGQNPKWSLSHVVRLFIGNLTRFGNDVSIEVIPWFLIWQCFPIIQPFIKNGLLF